tara:strand:+ start:276 stop:470 length:195 start_codon:yes stop_codon:yes gene_type:complete
LFLVQDLLEEYFLFHLQLDHLPLHLLHLNHLNHLLLLDYLYLVLHLLMLLLKKLNHFLDHHLLH